MELKNSEMNNRNKFCPKCGYKLRYIPAGTSERNNAYSEFWVCDNPKDKYNTDCGFVGNRDKVDNFIHNLD